MLSGLFTHNERDIVNRKGFITAGILFLLFVALLIVMITGLFLIVMFPLVVGGLFAWITWNRTRSLLLTLIVFVVTTFIMMRLM